MRGVKHICRRWFSRIASDCIVSHWRKPTQCATAYGIYICLYTCSFGNASLCCHHDSFTIHHEWTNSCHHNSCLLKSLIVFVVDILKACCISTAIVRRTRQWICRILLLKQWFQSEKKNAPKLFIIESIHIHYQQFHEKFIGWIRCKNPLIIHTYM